MNLDDLAVVIISSLPGVYKAEPDGYDGGARTDSKFGPILFEEEGDGGDGGDGVDDVVDIMEDFNVPICIPDFTSQWVVNTYPVDGRFVRLIEIEASGYERRLS
jgi:hypothetical protein